ncbi:ABC transporter ATP-binding protein [Anaeromicropila populeti]|uniref:Sodium transport system ATP-binding protein n=1 Tax=Anaeromicropila populeti TaxID=37658 RepID=A0A1I6IXW2_9FIRM|nr:ABC transporter ATP-binding protein [Anaeromicropila populeti]SFR71592.1 sodium transport system ATP-binding protein [Anaeromicropila populeti]
MIEIENFTKVYKLSKKQRLELKTRNHIRKAVDGVSLLIPKGEIFGLLGPNGAGKTTTLRCISTLLKPTQGSIRVCGHDTIKHPEKVRKKIGFLTNEIRMDPDFSAKYMFEFFGHLHGLNDEVIGERRKKLFSYFEIEEFQNKKIEQLSTGMKQKISIAVSLVHDPEVIIFDEPTNGLDIVTARSVTNYLQLLKEEGKLVLISTHIMSEAERLCDRVAIIVNGKKVIDGSLEYIMDTTGTRNLEDAFFNLYLQYTERGKV